MVDMGTLAAFALENSDCLVETAGHKLPTSWSVIKIQSIENSLHSTNMIFMDDLHLVKLSGIKGVCISVLIPRG